MRPPVSRHHPAVPPKRLPPNASRGVRITRSKAHSHLQDAAFLQTIQGSIIGHPQRRPI